MAEVTVRYDGPIVSREEAQVNKLVRYFTAQPCRHQHIAQRLTSSGECTRCAWLHKQKHRKPPITFSNRAFNFKDLAGKRYGRLLVLSAHHKTCYGATYWTCVCDCGVQKEITGQSLRSGAVVSCGCYAKQKASETFSRHKLTHTRAYGIWRDMRARCRDSNQPAYKHYGGRGISVCERWHKFEYFLEDMGHPPDGYSIERINNSASYGPDNCKWANQFEQMNNTRKNVFVEYNGERKTIAQWSRQLNINHRTLMGRYNSGWLPEDILRPVKPRQKRKSDKWPTTHRAN